MAAVSQTLPFLSNIWKTRWTPFSGLVLTLASYGLLVWALVTYGENNATHSQCDQRTSGAGFQGNSDMYGLGIRLGVYLQWIGSSVGSIWLPSEWRPLLTSYLFFNAALMVAMFILTFRFDCTYTAEVLVFLYLWWGGGFVINAGGVAKRTLYDGDVVTAIRKTGNWYQPNTLDAIQAYLSGVMAIFSSWFWIRLRTQGEVDFVPTPAGTYYFLFSRLRVSDSEPALTFMVFLCILYACAWIYFRSNSYIVSRKLRKGRKTDEDPETNDKETMMWARFFADTALILFFVYTVLAVELTLVWNNITDVYDIASTGQVIPLILGGGIVLSTCWKLIPQEYSHRGMPPNLNTTYWNNFELDEESNIRLLIKEASVSLQSDEAETVEIEAKQ